MLNSSRQLTFAFTGTWAQFMALTKSMKGIKGSFYRRTEC